MTARFLSNLVVLLVGATLVAFAIGMGEGTAAWVAFGAGCAAAVAALVAFPVRGRGSAQRWIDALTLLVASWTIVASRTFDGPALKWLAFGSGCAFALLGVTGLAAHEVVMERAARRLVGQGSDGRVQPAVERPPIGVAR